MQHLVEFLRRVRDEEDGHAIPAIPALFAAVGGLALACGSANDIEWVSWLGGVLVAVGVVGAALAHHVTIDYEVFDRLEKLEQK